MSRVNIHELPVVLQWPMLALHAKSVAIKILRC